MSNNNKNTDNNGDNNNNNKSIQDRLKPNTIIKNKYGGYPHHYSPRFIVGYWSIRGLAAPIRMMLSAAQVDHWVVMYDVLEKGDNDWDRSSWFNDKEWLKKEYHPLMNLPFLVDCSNNQVIVQTNAILTYLGRELHMLGTTKIETIQCEEFLCEIMDVRNAMVGFAYKTDESTAKEEAQQLVTKANRSFEKLEQYFEIKHDKEKGCDSVCHLVGHKFTAPDFHLWEMLDQFEGLCKHYELPSSLFLETKFPHLKEFWEKFIQLEANQAYAKRYGLQVKNGGDDDNNSRTTIQIPYNNPYARFGSDATTLGMYQRKQETPWKNKGIIEDETPYPRVDNGIPQYWDMDHHHDKNNNEGNDDTNGGGDEPGPKKRRLSM